MGERLSIEQKTFDRHIHEWRSSEMGKFVLIKDTKVISFYNSLTAAFEEGIRRFGMDDFFIDQILPSDPVNISFLAKVA